jgi:hypothetical protein
MFINMVTTELNGTRLPTRPSEMPGKNEVMIRKKLATLATLPRR